MLQEQVSEYLGVTSFKRKYPGKKEHCTSIQLPLWKTFSLRFNSASLYT